MRTMTRPIAARHAAMAVMIMLSVPLQAFAQDSGALTTAQKNALKSNISQCDKLPRDRQDACVDEARQSYARMEPSLSPAQKAALERESAAYKAAVSDCKKRPGSEQGACLSRAGQDHRLAGLSMK